MDTLFHKIFIHNPTYFSLTAIFRENTNIVGSFSRPLHIKKNIKSRRKNVKHIDIITENKITEIYHQAK
jgi:hypothetical protein